MGTHYPREVSCEAGVGVGNLNPGGGGYVPCPPRDFSPAAIPTHDRNVSSRKLGIVANTVQDQDALSSVWQTRVLAGAASFYLRWTRMFQTKY